MDRSNKGKDTKKERRISLKERIKKSILLCGRHFEIRWHIGNTGGEFQTLHPEVGGGRITIGDGPPDEYFQLCNVVHEIAEVVLTLNNWRWADSDGRIIFSMTHDEFVTFCEEVTRGIIETGLIKVNETGDK